MACYRLSDWLDADQRERNSSEPNVEDKKGNEQHETKNKISLDISAAQRSKGTQIMLQLRALLARASSLRTKTKLPALAPEEFDKFNWMAARMDYFHSSFRRTWTTLYDICQANQRPSITSLRQLFSLSLDFCRHLESHHRSEERLMFPLLARKMSAFRDSERMLAQHEALHAGLKRLEVYLLECKNGKKELRLGEVKEIMDGFGEVLWAHLDEEVRLLGAENMRQYWSLEEVEEMRG